MSFADEQRRRRQRRNELELRELLGTLDMPEPDIDLQLSVEAALLIIDAATRLAKRLPEIGLDEALALHVDHPERAGALDIIRRYEAISDELTRFARLIEAQLK